LGLKRASRALPLGAANVADGSQHQSLICRDNTIELLIGAAPHRVEWDGQSSLRLLASEHSKNAGETSYVFTCTIRVV
jgi:hypothetical protein